MKSFVLEESFLVQKKTYAASETAPLIYKTKGCED